MPEHTTGHEPEPATIEKPELKPKPQITLELEPAPSDQMSGPATSLVSVDLLIEHEGMTWSTTPSTAADGEALIDCESECFLPFSFPAPSLFLHQAPHCLSLCFRLPVPCQPRESFLKFMSVLYRPRKLFVNPCLHCSVL